MNRVAISEVVGGSIAEELGIEPGDYLLAINGQQVDDLIDYRYLCAEEYIEVEILKTSGEEWVLTIDKDYDEDLGIGFASAIGGPMKQCANHCQFCFVDQMPPRMRESLYEKDDDYRLSFLQGNFITLTNIKEPEWQRILKLRLSPLYISVHATDQDVRHKLMGNQRAGEIMTQLQELAQHGLEVHAQVVLCPGVNDGAVLERTINDLAGLWPAVCSVALVPVGLTRYREQLSPLRPYRPQEAAVILEKVADWQARFAQVLGYRLVFAADEFYLLAGVAIPETEDYEDFPQTENGVGLVRLFKDELAEMLPGLPQAVGSRRVGIITGVSVGGLLQDAVAQITARTRGIEAHVVPVTNNYFGPTVTVTGLLTGSDLREVLRQEKADFFLLPRVMLRSGEELFLDNLTVAELAQQIGKKIKVVPPTATGLVEGLTG